MTEKAFRKIARTSPAKSRVNFQSLQFGQNNGPSPSLSSYESLLMLRQDLIMYTLITNARSNCSWTLNTWTTNISSTKLKRLSSPPETKLREQMRVCSRFDGDVGQKKKFDEGRIDECSRFLIQLNINHSRSLADIVNIWNRLMVVSYFANSMRKVKTWAKKIFLEII